MPPYEEWGRQGPSPWVYWAIVAALVALILGLVLSD
jgi:hypothetical protein